jgi:hypothetical protein
MIYRKNVGTIEQVARIAAGAALVVCGLVGLAGNPVGYVLAGAGAITALTGLFGFCPACAMVGRKLNEKAP